MNRPLIYLHGFNSAPSSPKAVAANEYFSAKGFGFWAPELGIEISENFRSIEEHLSSFKKDEPIYFIASSLGAYQLQHFLVLSQRTNFKAVVVNPAVRPFYLFEDYLGPGENPYTGKKYVIGARHLSELKAIYHDQSIAPQNFLVLLSKGDEVLDYKLAASMYSDSELIIEEGGDHSFANFTNYFDKILQFFCPSV